MLPVIFQVGFPEIPMHNRVSQLSCMQDVKFENNVVEGTAAGDRLVGVTTGSKPSKVYASPRMKVWPKPDGPAVDSISTSAANRFIRDNMLPVEADWMEALEVSHPL